jgi:hypothetical protein
MIAGSGTDGRRRVRRALQIAVLLLIPAAAHAIWDQLEATWLAADIAALDARDEPITAKSERSFNPNAAERNAARFYSAAGELAASRARQSPRAFDVPDRIEGTLTTPDREARLRSIQSEFVDGEPALDLLDRATALPFSGFGDVDPGLNLNASPLDQLNALNAARADLLSAERRPAEAVRAIAASVLLQRAMPNAFYEEQAAVRTFGSLRLLLRTNVVAPDALAFLRQAYQTVPDEDRARRDLMDARARLLDDFWPYAADRTSWALRLRLRTLREIQGVPLLGPILRPWMTHRFRAMLRGYADAIDAAAQPWPQKIDASASLVRRYSVDTERPSAPSGSLADHLGVFMPYYGAFALNWSVRAAGQLLSCRRVAVMVLAVEQYRRVHAGQPPASLETLVPQYLSSLPVDPFSGRPLIFRVSTGSYSVYGVDVNRRDDNGAFYGVYSGRRPSQADRAHGDIGIRVPLAPGE